MEVVEFSPLRGVEMLSRIQSRRGRAIAGYTYQYQQGDVAESENEAKA